MPKRVEAQINSVGNGSGKIEVVTTETIKETYNHIGAVCDELSNNKWQKITGIGLSIGLAVGAVTKLSESIFPLISPNLITLNNFPVLSQYSEQLESPIVIGALAAFSAAALGMNAFRNRTRYQAIEDKLRQAQITSINPSQPLGNTNP